MSPRRKFLSVHSKFLAVLLFLALAVAFTLPLLGDLQLSGSGDWDYFMFLYEVPSISLFEYRQFPLWNPYCGGGLSMIGNPQAGFLSPIFLLTALFGVPAGLKIAVTVHTFAGLLGMWLLAGHIGIRGPARLAPPVIFMFSSAWALHIAMGHIVWLPAALLPWFFLCFLKGQQSLRWLLTAALVESVMFYEGGTYVFAYSLIFLAIYAVIEAIDGRTWRPLFSFIAVNATAAVLSAPKLLPVLEVLRSNPRPTGAGIGMPFEIFLFFFFDRFASIERSPIDGWWAFGTYLGVVVVVLYLFSITLYRHNKALVVTSVLLLLVSMGNFAPFSPWNLLHQLPGFNAFKIPTRVLIVFCFTAALLVGRALSHLAPERSRRQNLLVGLTIAVIFIDLATVSFPVLKDVNRPMSTVYWEDLRIKQQGDPPTLYRLSAGQTTGIWWQVASVHQPFTQISIPFDRRNQHGAWSDQYWPLLQNRGVVDAYETIPFPRHAVAKSDNRYRGEYYLTGAGSVKLSEWTPNRLRFRVDAAAGDLLVINQNHAGGWRSSQGEITTHEGLLAIDLEPGHYDLEISYSPESFWKGVQIFAITLLMLVLLSCSRRCRRLWHNTPKQE